MDGELLTGLKLPEGTMKNRNTKSAILITRAGRKALERLVQSAHALVYEDMVGVDIGLAGGSRDDTDPLLIYAVDNKFNDILDSQRRRRKSADAVVVELDWVNPSVIGFGATVRVWAGDSEEEEEYLILDGYEYEGIGQSISYSSRIAQMMIALGGKGTFTMDTGKGDVTEFEILGFSYDHPELFAEQEVLSE